jgi:hypothetical protein
MRYRDLTIVIVSVLAIVIAFSQEHAVAFRKGFLLNLPEMDVGGDHLLPRPVIADLNWDGYNEVILLSATDMISIIPSSLIRRSYDNHFIDVPPRHIAALPSTCIGLGVGHAKGNATYLPPQVIAAVTNDYIVALYSHELQELWSVRIPDIDIEYFVPRTSAVVVLPQAIYEDDTGVVVVGVDTAPNNRTLGGVHFSYYAFNLKDGSLRWQHDATSFRDADSTEQKRYPHRSFKLSTKDLEHHNSEVDWRTFRHSIMEALPHRHEHPWDTYFSPKAFSRTKNKKKREGHTSHKDDTSRPKYQTRSRQGNEEYGEFGARLTAALAAKRERRHPSPNVLVVHHSKGLEVLHLFTGRPICQVGPLMPHVTYDDFNGDLLIDSAVAHIAHEQVYNNGIIEERAVCAGTISSNVPYTQELLFEAPICRSGPGIQLEMMLSFLRGNEDDDSENGVALPGWGSADHFDSKTRATAPAAIHRRVRSGIGIERMTHDVVFHLNSGHLTSVDTRTRSVRWRVGTQAWFSNRDDSRREEAENPNGERNGPYPHTLAYNPSALVHHVSDPYVLAVGESAIALVHVGSGIVEETLSLEGPAVAPVLIGDFNSDGTNDLLVLTRNGYRGYIAVQRQGGGVLPYLLLSVLFLVGLLLFSQRFSTFQDPWAWQYATGGKRSTD